MRRLAAILVAVALAVTSAAGAQTPEESIRDARDKRDQVRSEQAEAARRLDVLEAEEDEMLAALEVLDVRVTAQEARVAESEQAVTAARNEAFRLRDEILLTEKRVVEINDIGRRRAAEAFVRADRDLAGQLLTSVDPNQAVRKQSYLRFATFADLDLADELRRLDDDLRRLRSDAEVQEERARIEEDRRQVILTELEADWAAQERLRAQLADRISLIESELDEMAAQEGELSALIQRKQKEIAERAAAANVPSPGTAQSAQGMIWPTQGRFSSGFGYRRHPILGYSRLHAGVDIGNSSGTPIWAAKAGTVIFSGWRGGYGNAVIVDHGGGVSTLYGHMSQRLVSEGTNVGTGETVGLMGSTGMSTGPHLHFEVRINGSPNDPLAFLP